MSEDVDEESKIIEERASEIKSNLALALSIDESIEQILYRKPVLVQKDTTVEKAINLFNEKDVGCVLIVEKTTNKLIGIFTERDVIRKVIKRDVNLQTETIEKHMTKNPDSLCLNDPIAYALNRMAAGGYRHIPLVDEKNIPVGYLSVRDIIDHLADYYSNEILNLPPSSYAKQVTQEGG